MTTEQSPIASLAEIRALRKPEPYKGKGIRYDGEQVKIASFGTFLVRDKAKRIGRNPKTGEEHEIPPRRVLVFRASQVLKQALVEDWKGGPLEAYIEASDNDE